MSRDLRRVVGQRAMKAWVSREVVTISLVRQTRALSTAGGKAKTGETTLAPQRFRVAATARQHDMDTTTTAGEVQGADWLLISEDPGADVKKGDTFQLHDRWWRVRFIDQRKEWRVGAGVVEHGGLS